jgi:hypothetical protein
VAGKSIPAASRTTAAPASRLRIDGSLSENRRGMIQELLGEHQVGSAIRESW